MNKEAYSRHFFKSLQRIEYSFNLYKEGYPHILLDYENTFGISEYRFTEIEIDIIEEFLQYQKFFNREPGFIAGKKNHGCLNYMMQLDQTN